VTAGNPALPPCDPVGLPEQPIPIWHGEFAADPHAAYLELRRRHGELAPVEIAPGVAAILVLDRDVAQQILFEDERYPVEPGVWERGVTRTCPVRSLFGGRPDALRSDGVAHTRYRGAVTDALKDIDQFALGRSSRDTAKDLINTFCHRGTADLLHEFAIPVTSAVVGEMLGLPPTSAQQAFAATTALYDSSDPGTAHQVLIEAMQEAIQQPQPGPSVISTLMRHPARLSEHEAAHALAMLYSLGTELTWCLISLTLLTAMTENPEDGGLSIRDLIDETLFTDPPMATTGPRFARQMQLMHKHEIQPHVPVLISLAACNRSVAGDTTGNRSHLGWGAGRHACPAQPQALIIAEQAVGELLDALPDIKLAIPADQLPWRPTPFRRALQSLPATFRPAPLLPPT